MFCGRITSFGVKIDMLTKTCGTCHEIKPLREFCAAPRNLDGRSILCKSCKSSYDKQRRAFISQNTSDEQRAEKKRKSKLWRIANREELLRRKKIFYQKNLIAERAKRLSYMKLRYQTDPLLRLRQNLNRGIRRVLKQQGTYKSSKTMSLVGCSLIELKLHIESKFSNGMSWDNYSKWHIDHIIPCSSFNLRDASERSKCFHFSNLQPLWAEENLRKGSRLDYKTSPIKDAH